MGQSRLDVYFYDGFILIQFADIVLVQIRPLGVHLYQPTAHLSHVIVASKLIQDHWLLLIVHPLVVNDKLVLIGARVKTDLHLVVPVHLNHGLLLFPVGPRANKENLLTFVLPE